MSNSDFLKKYDEEIEKIRLEARELSLSETQINEIFQECFITLKKSTANYTNYNNKAQQMFYGVVKVLAILLLLLVILYVVLNVHQPTTSIVLRNVQGLIYPGLSLLRFLSVPVIKKYPSLTKLYDESCLLENPYFYVSDMECWPCQNVYSVIDLTDFGNHSMYHTGIPYIIKSNQPLVTYEDIVKMYLKNREVFDKDANLIKSLNTSLKTIGDLTRYSPNISLSSDNQISWRINTMTPARIVRKLFQRPYIISEWSGQTIERYIMIDEPKTAPYQLPNFECSYIFLIQGSGQQTIILKPTKECSGECRTVSVVLKPSFVLWYNWWYWRPISVPTKNATEVSISYINSYC